MVRRKVPPGSLLKRPLGQVFIAEWREYRGYERQEDLAADVVELTGRSMSGATLSRIENSRSPYQQWQLEALAELLKCTPADLISRDPTDNESDEVLLARLKPASRESVQRTIRAYAAQEGLIAADRAA